MSSAQKEVDAIFKDLDSLPSAPTGGSVASATGTGRSTPLPQGDSAIQALAELGDLAKSSDTPTKSRIVAASGIARPSSRATERVSLSSLKAKNADAAAAAAIGVPQPTSAATTSATSPAPTDASTSAQLGGSWGWGSVWSSASAAVQQAKAVVDEGVKNLPKVPQADQTRQWREGLVDYVKNAQLDKIGQDFKAVSLSTFQDILNVVAPPIAEHEVIQVWLSHDLEGYDGVETLVYRALSRILEQVEGGDLIVNKGNESRPKDQSGPLKRNLNAVEEFSDALKLAKADIDNLIKAGGTAPKGAENISPDSLKNPTTYSTVYLRIQPYTVISPFQTPLSSPTQPARQIQFLLHLRDPSHSLDMSTITQALPSHWMDLWERHEWVEDQLAETLRLGVEMLGQEYVVARMGWDTVATTGHEASANETLPTDVSTDTDDFEKVDRQ